MISVQKDTRATRKSGINRKSAKAKGRRGCQRAQQALLKHFPILKEADVFVKAGSQTGCDLNLSELAKRYFRFSTEVKAVEALNIWSALAQAEANAEAGRPPIVFFMRNNSKTYVALSADDFLTALTGTISLND